MSRRAQALAARCEHAHLPSVDRLAAPAGLHGQGQAGARIHRIGYLSPGTYTPGNDLDAFRSALTDLGWSEPRNIVIVQRWSGATAKAVTAPRLPATSVS